MSNGSPQASRSRPRLRMPIRVGLICALLGILLAIVGIVRGMVPLRPISIFLALLISGGTWGIVSWAIATAAEDVDRDIAEAEAQATETDSD